MALNAREARLFFEGHKSKCSSGHSNSPTSTARLGCVGPAFAQGGVAHDRDGRGATNARWLDLGYSLQEWPKAMLCMGHGALRPAPCEECDLYHMILQLRLTGVKMEIGLIDH